MKNFLSKLWSLSRTDRVRTLAIDAVSLPSFCRVNMLKLVSVLAILLTVGVGNAWADYTIGFGTDGSNWISSGGDYVDSYSPSGSVYKESSAIRFGKGSGTGSITVDLTSSGTYIGQIKASKITLNGVVRYGSDASVNVRTTVTYTGSDGSVEDNYTAPTSAGTHDIVLDGTKTIASVRVESTANGKRFYCTGFTVTAAASCAKKVTITKGTPESGGAFSLDKTGAQDCCEALTVTVSGITAPSGKKFSAITQSGIASGVTIDQSAKTVTYAANSNGSSTINVTFESKGCTDHYGTNVTSGSTQDNKLGPCATYYKYSTRQILYTKTDLNLSVGKKGTIKSISFDYATASDVTRNVTIYMANTSLTSLSNTAGSFVPFSEFTQVYTGSVTFTAGYNEIELSSNYEYNGIGNLVVLIDDNTGSYVTTDYFNTHTASTITGNAQIWTGDDDTNQDPSATSWTGYTPSTSRPNTKFCIQEADMTPATVTLMDNGATITEASAGAGVTLPSRAGCTGYTFAGWTKTWVAPQSSWTTTAPTIIPAGSYTPAADENLYPVYTKTEGGGSPEFSQYQQVALGGTITAGKYLISTGSYTMAGSGKTGVSLTPGTTEAAAREYTVAIVSGTTITIKGPDNKYIGGLDKADGLTFSTTTPSSDDYRWVYTENGIQNKSITGRHIKAYSTTDFRHYGTGNGTLTYFYKRIETSGSTTYYISVPNCCTDPGLNYGTGSVTKTYGADAFTNTLTNSHSVAVTYSSSDPTVATVNGSGQVTILKAGSTTITASSAAQTVAAVSYCADEASYTLTVNKANISPTLTYTPNSVAVGENTSAPTVGGNPGSGGVTYTITSATPVGCATINTSTGVVTGVAVGSVTVTATVAATTNYNGNTATATVTITAASYFPQNKTLFFEAKTQSESAWKDGAQCKAWFRDCDSDCGEAPWTYWQTDGDSYKKYYAVVIPSTGNYPYITIQRYSDYTGNTSWGEGGAQTYSTGGGSNVIKSTCASGECLSWSPTSMQIYLRGDLTNDEWASNIGELTDQNGGIWSYTYNNFASDGSSLDFKLYTNYNTWIGNTSSNNNATLSGMNDGSTYNITATYNVVTHSLVMSKTFVKGTVHFDLQGHGLAISDLTNVAAGSKISAPSPAPSATGWDFGGWFKEPACTNEWTFASDEVNETMTLYAKWTKHNYTITSTLTNCSSSPAIPSSYEYTGSAASLSHTITPSSGYRLPTTITVTGTTYTWDSGTGALVLTGTISSNVTISITAVQTHTVDWYVGGSAPANKIGDDGQTTVVDHGGKIEDFPATTPDGSACDKEFVGWTNTSSYVHGTSPLFNDVAGSPTINADASFYAVFATGGATEYVLTPAASLSAGRYVIAAYDDSNSKFVALTGAVSAASTGSNSDMVNETTGFTISEGKFTSLPTGACEFVLTAYTGSTDEGFYIQNPADDKYLDYQDGASVTNRRLWYYEAEDYVDEYDNPTTPFAAWYGVALSKDGFPDNGMYLKYVDGSYSLMSNGSSTTFVRGYANDNTKYKPVYLFKKTGGLSGYTITCADCGTSVTPTYTAAPAGGTVSVTKSAAAVASGSTVKTCTAVDLTVTITPAPHYTLTGFTATGLSTGTATISPAVGSTLPKTTETTFTVTVSSGATGTLNLTPTFTEDAHVAINWNVNGVNQSIAATEGLTWVYSGGDLTALPSEPSVPAGCSGTKVFAGWSAKHSDATEEDASYYDDLFTAVGDAPTGISSEKTFYAVFATSSANPLAGEVMWDEPWTGTSDKTTPTSPSSGATVYNSTVLTYAYTDGNTITQVYADGTMYSGGAAAPELLISKTSPSGVWTVTNIPTGGSAQTELTLSYKTNKTTIAVTSGTSGITIGDATVDGNTYTHTITITHSPSTINNFSLIFTNTGSANARIDDIHLVVPGSGTMTDYVTLCAPSYTITYNKNTEDAVTNLPSPTSVLQSTGSGTLSSTVPERATYTFSGWAETTSGAVAYAAGGSITGVSADKTLYAVWTKTPVEELFLNYSELNKYVGDPAVTLEVTGVTPEGADPSVTWSSNNSSVASVVAATGVVTFGTVGTATITATSSVTGTTTAYCYVTVRNKPTASFTDLIHDGNGTDLSTYHMQNVAGTAIVFPTLDDYATPGDDCDSKHYIFVGWTTSDNNDDPEDNLVTSDELEDDQDKVFYAVWADGVEGVSYTKLTTSTFKTSPTKYVIGAIDGDDTFYFYSCAATDANNGNGGCTNAPGTNAPIQFTLSGTADALVATSTEASARYLTPLTAKNFQMSATSKTIQLNDDGTIANPSEESWTLRFNTSEDYLRWYSSATGNAAYFYEVTAGAAVSYRTSCCTNNVPAPTVVATNTAYTVTLTWGAVDGATGYEVSWNGGAFTAATSPCVKSGLTASTDYIYKVRATYDPLVKCGALVASGNVTTDDVYTVTYSGGTGTGSCSPSGSVAPASYEAGATVTLASTNSFSLTSNTFAAWVVKDADDNDVPVSNNQFTMPAKNVTVTATWTAVQDKYYDRMHDGTDALHGGIADGEGKYYLVLEGCNYTVPTLTDDDDGDTECHTTHFKLLGWIAYSHLKTDGSGEIKPGEESYIFQGGGTKSATGATYYAIWAIMTE